MRTAGRRYSHKTIAINGTQMLERPHALQDSTTGRMAAPVAEEACRHAVRDAIGRLPLRPDAQVDYAVGYISHMLAGGRSWQAGSHDPLVKLSCSLASMFELLTGQLAPVSESETRLLEFIAAIFS